MSVEKKDKNKTEEPAKKKLVALKDFHIFMPGGPVPYDIKIKAGDDLGDVPEMFHQNLKTEGVI